MSNKRITDAVLGSQVEVATLASAAENILAMAEARRPAFICFTTAFMLVKAATDERIHRMYRQCDINMPDGMPVAWALRALGNQGAECISGPRLTPLLLREAAGRGISVGFYGGRAETLERMEAALTRDLPGLNIVYRYSPPFRQLSPEEQREILDEMTVSGMQMLFVGLGSPKQDLWMHDHGSAVPCVSLGVGAAFEFLSGEKVLPPFWVQQLGLTWLVRLCQEPRRLIVRNLYSPVFVAMFAMQMLFGARFERRFSSASLDGELR